MALELGDDVVFEGPALPEAFVRHELEKALGPALPKPKSAQPPWETYRRAIRQPLTGQSGRYRVKNVVLDPLAELLGYAIGPGGDPVVTREGPEGPGLLLRIGAVTIRTFAVDYQGDLDAPAERGQTYRYTPRRIAERILLATGERVGLLTNGDDLRLLLSDPARPGSSVTFKLNLWRSLTARDPVPDGFRLLLAFLDPDLLAPQKGKDGARPSKLQDLLDAARLKQGQITKDLRHQARRAVEQFLQGVLDHPSNRERFGAMTPAQAERLPRLLWREGLILVYRLLFILRGEAAGTFRFATTSPWRHTYSPGFALAGVARRVLDQGADTGHYLEQGLRKLFEIFERGLHWQEAHIDPLGGRLFGREETPLLSSCAWDEVGCARLLDQLLWTPEKSGRRGRRPEDPGPGRRRINYADLDVEDLGRVYEALLELEPGLATAPMARLRRAKLEVVVPSAQGAKYRSDSPPLPLGEGRGEGSDLPATDEPEPDSDDADEDSPGKKTKVEWVEEILPRSGSPGTFYLRVGLGRKASGSYYTPESFVRFLVEETLRPQVDQRSPKGDPKPLEILKLKVLDPAMGSGHFLVGACRYLGERLYEACRACDDREEWRERIPPAVIPYLPRHSQESGAEVGHSADRARSLCKRLVAVHCLYGVDKNALAVELAKVCLWLESQAEGMPLTFLDHRLVHGDSLTGPSWSQLTDYPGKQERIENLWAQGVQDQLQRRLTSVLQKVGRLQDTLGANPYEIADKQRLKREVDEELFPFHVLAMTWSGGVMLGKGRCDDQGYAELLQHASRHGTLPETLPEGLVRMLECGSGLAGLPADRREIQNALLQQAESGDNQGRALAYDLTFPEVFYPTAVIYDRKGFHAVLGNPPWDAVRPKAKEFFANFDFEILAAPTKRERTTIEQKLKSDPEIARQHEQYIEAIAQQQRCHERLFQHQVVEVNGEKTGGDPDLAKLFLERSTRLLRKDCFVGLVVPSAFHANEGATGIRRLYLEKMGLRHCYSFENRRKLFEIHSSFKFATVVAQAGEATDTISCAFYLHDDEWLFREKNGHEPLRYNLDFVRRTGGDHLSLLELRTPRDLEVAEGCFSRGEPFGQVCDRLGIRLGRELHMTDDAWRFTPTSEVLPRGEDPRDPDISARLFERGYLTLHEGKTFWHYDDHWEDRPRYLVSFDRLADKPTWRHSASYFRLAFRDIASSTNERTGVFNLCPPGTLFGNKAPCDRTPENRPNNAPLQILAVANSFPFDFLLRQRVQATLNLFIVNPTPFPPPARWERFAAHSTLRLTCNHSGYAPLWREQLGDAWREPRPPFTWPVLATDDERWAVRAAIDAIVADAYGLDRGQYAHVLSTFSHKSYPKAPDLCLAKFDELKRTGLDAFTKAYDPYWDIPLNESLPKPVIELPGVAAAPEGFQLEGGPPPSKKKSKRR